MVSSEPVTEERLGAFPIGNLAVWNEIEKGAKQEFADLRKDALIRHFLQIPLRWRSSDIVKTETFARRMITITSERTSRVEGKRSNVSIVAP